MRDNAQPATIMLQGLASELLHSLCDVCIGVALELSSDVHRAVGDRICCPACAVGTTC